MKKPYIFILILALLFPVFSSAQDLPVQYLSPLPDSKYNNKETNLIIRPYIVPNKNITKSSGTITVRGSLSGIHEGKTIIASDGQTIIFKPDKPFKLSETVFVKIGSRATGKSASYEYKFYIKEKEIPPSPPTSFTDEMRKKYSGNLYYNYNIKDNITFNDSLPPDMPPITVNVSNNPSPGKIFVACWGFTMSYGAYLLILNNDGTPFFYRKMIQNALDFKQISNGNLVYCDGNTYKYYELDTNYYIVDSFYTGNGYTLDFHDLEYLENGNAYVMAYDTTFMDMSQIVQGGDTNAMVIGLIVQEINVNKNVIFQWRSWDHIPITDCLNQDLCGDTIDYVHGNAVELDSDGNIMISSRHLDEITKINRTTGNIIWRLGGKQNQFTFTNDTNKFNFQHDIRRLKNGHITLYDNGNAHTPPFSRAVEYAIDEQAKTVTLVWEYRNTPSTFGAFMGNVQRLENGNTIIGWGGNFGPLPTVTEVSPNGTKLLEMKFPVMVFSYRAYKFNWDYVDPGPPKPTSYVLKQNYPNPFNPITNIEFDLPEAQYVKLKIYDITGREVAQLVNQSMPAQKHLIKWDASNFSSGVYFYQITTDNFKVTKKMILLR